MGPGPSGSPGTRNSGTTRVGGRLGGRVVNEKGGRWGDNIKTRSLTLRFQYLKNFSVSPFRPLYV